MQDEVQDYRMKKALPKEGEKEDYSLT